MNTGHDSLPCFLQQRRDSPLHQHHFRARREGELVTVCNLSPDSAIFLAERLKVHGESAAPCGVLFKTVR